MEPKLRRPLLFAAIAQLRESVDSPPPALPPSRLPPPYPSLLPSLLARAHGMWVGERSGGEGEEDEGKSANAKSFQSRAPVVSTPNQLFHTHDNMFADVAAERDEEGDIVQPLQQVRAFVCECIIV